MRKSIALLLTSSFLCFSSVAKGDEAQVRMQVENVATALVSGLELSERMVLKVLSPEQSGLPEGFLRKLSSDLEAALLVASNFQINLANRLTTEELWSEAVEFGDADFNELYAASQADVMLMLSPRATAAGVEISTTAYRLTGPDAGRVLASTGSTLLSIDLGESLGLDVVTVTQQVGQILQEIERVGQTGGLISSATTYAELYHNARILQQRGEIDLAINNFEAAVRVSPFPFVDPVEDLVALAQVRYGTGHQAYVETRLKEFLSEELYQYALWLAAPRSTQLTIHDLADQSEIFPPLIVVWLEQNLQDLESRVRQSFRTGKPDYNSLFMLLEGARAYLRSLEEGSLQSFYIDKLRARSALSASNLRNIIDEFSMMTYSFFETDYEIGTGRQYIEADCDNNISTCDFSASARGIPSYNMGMAGVPQYISDINAVDAYDDSFPAKIPVKKLSFDKIDYKALSWEAIFPAVSDQLREQLAKSNLPSPYNSVLSAGSHINSLARHLGPCGFVLDNEPTTYNQIWLKGRDGSSTFGGIGLSIELHETGPRISGVLPGSPASAVGLGQGDYIFSINDNLYWFETKQEVEQVFIDLIDTEIKLTIFKADSQSGSIDVFVTPDSDLEISSKGMSNAESDHNESYASKNFTTLDMYARDMPIRETGQQFNSELIIAPYDSLLIADFCIDILSQSVIVDKEKFSFAMWNFITPDHTVSEFGVSVHPNLSRLGGTLAQLNYTSWPENLSSYRDMAHANGLFKMSGLQGLLITDNVDRNRPILLLYTLSDYVGAATWNNILGAIDLRFDGTSIYSSGMPFNPKYRNVPHQDGIFSSIDVIPNNWFYAPGVIQGTVGLFQPKIIGVKYTDMRGQEKLKTNVLINGDGVFNGDYFPSAPPGILFSEQCQEDVYNNPVWSGDPKFTYSGDLTCPDVIEHLDIPDNKALWCYYYDNNGNRVRSEHCISGFSLPRALSFTKYRRAHFHDLIELTMLNSIASFSRQVNMDAIERIFRGENLAARQYLQRSLQNVGMYSGRIDGVWGPGTQAAFSQLFEAVAALYPEGEYFSMYNLSDRSLSRDEFVDFWNTFVLKN